MTSRKLASTDTTAAAATVSSPATAPTAAEASLAPAGAPVTATAGLPVTAGVPVASPSTAVSPVALALALRTARAAIINALTGLRPNLDTIDNDQRAHVGRASPARVAVMPLVANLLAVHPDLSATVAAEDITTELANADALQGLSDTLKAAELPIQDTRRLILKDVAARADSVLVVARARARKDPEWRQAMLPIENALARGTRSKVAPHVAVNQQQKATAATARASKAQQRASAATARAAASQPAETPAATHPSGHSPVPVANPQGPAASADVSPQGPAPGK